MYKNPIFGDIIPQKTINSYSNNIFPKFVKILQICKHFPHNISPKNSPPPSCFTFQLLYGSVENYWGIDCALLPNREWNQKQKPKKQHQISQKRFCMVGTRYFASASNG